MPSVLVVDDVEAHAYILKKALLAAGCDVKFAVDGLSGVEQAAGGSFDAIFLDIRLPDIDGFEVCKRIRALTNIPQPAIVFHSSSSLPGEDYDVQSPGGDAFLTYPVDAEHVASVLRGSIARRQQLNKTAG